MRLLDVRVCTVIALLGAAGCGGRAPISSQPEGQRPVMQLGNGGPPSGTTDPGTGAAGDGPDDSCTAGSRSVPYAGGDPCPQTEPQCPAPMYQAVATCGPDGIWVRDASGTIQCACIPTTMPTIMGTGGPFTPPGVGGTGGGFEGDTGGGPAIGVPPPDNRGAGVCDCSKSQGIITPASFECVCALAGCTPHAHVAELPVFDCANSTESGSWFDYSTSYVAHGCGLVAIMHSYSTGGTTRVYRESDHELVGAGIGQDTGFAICDTATYMTANTDLSLCPDYTICSPCHAGLYPACPGSQTEDDGGTETPI